jgi:RNA recognition motif-containing protein
VRNLCSDEVFSVTKSIYVGNLPWSATEEEIRNMFAAHGTVNSVKLVTDRETGRARGFCFVEMPADDAATAIQALSSASLGGRALRINEAQPKAPRQPRY